jgi:hypothetical protein
MSIEAFKVVAIEFASAAIALPLIFWATMYGAARWWSINWRPILPWLKFLRWVGWGCGTAMVLISLSRSASPVKRAINNRFFAWPVASSELG